MYWVGGVVGGGVFDRGDIEVAEAEVAVTGLVGVGSPGGVSNVGELVFIDLFGTGEKALLFVGLANENTGIGEGFVGANLLVFGGIGLSRQLDWLGPDAFVAAGEGLVDRGFEPRLIEWFLATGCPCDEPGQHERQGDSFTHLNSPQRVGCGKWGRNELAPMRIQKGNDPSGC